MKTYSLGHKTSADDGWEIGLGPFPSKKAALASYNTAKALKRGTGILKFDDDAPHISDLNLWERGPGGNGTVGYSVYPK